MNAQKILLGFVVAVFIAIGRSFATSKVTECNSIVKVADQATAVGQELKRSFESKDSSQIIQTLNNSMTKIGKMEQEIKALTIKDTKLVNFRSRFVNNYQDYNAVMQKMLNAAQANNTTELYQVVEEAKVADEREKTLIAEFNNYCVGSSK
jgi:hypothetical protein